jgi:hypothetical protein
MARVRIVCIGDTQGQHAGLRVPDSDILIHAGDFMTYGNAPREIIDANNGNIAGMIAANGPTPGVNPNSGI